MKPKTILLASLTIASLIPPVAAALLLEPFHIITAALFIISLLTIIVIWRNAARHGTSPTGSHYLSPAKSYRLPRQSPDRDNLIDRLTLTMEEVMTSFDNNNAKPDQEKIRQELQKRMSWLFEKRQEIQQVEDKEVTVLLSDLRGFTVITENYSPIKVVDMLNRYFTRMCEIIYRHGGKVDKFIGDSIMALFATEGTRGKPAEQAVLCAVEMQIAMTDFNKENETLGMPAQYMGIGVNTGRVIAGWVGSELHSEYTVIGDGINLASRIEASTLRGQVLISKATYADTKNLIEVDEPVHVSVKGKREPLCLYEVTGVGAPYNLKVPEREIRRSRRVDVSIPFRFQICEGKIICSDTHEGRILNISAGGMLACTLTDVAPLLNIKFSLGFNIIGAESGDIYGKILKVIKKDELYHINIEYVVITQEDSNAIRELVNRTIKENPAAA